MKYKKISISLPEDVYEKTKASLEDTGATFSGFVKVCLKERLERDE